MPEIMPERKVEVLTLSAKRPRAFDGRLLHVPATTRGMGQVHINTSAVITSAVISSNTRIASKVVWGWWRDDDRGSKNHDLVKRWTDMGSRFIVDLEPDAWHSGRGLGPWESKAVALADGVTSWGNPTDVAAALHPFAEAGKRGLIQLYRAGADPSVADVTVLSRILRYRAMGFENITGVLGGNRSGRTWNEAALKVCASEGVTVAVWGYDSIAQDTALKAQRMNLGGYME